MEHINESILSEEIKEHQKALKSRVEKLARPVKERGKDRPYGISARHGGIKIGYHKTGG